MFRVSGLGFKVTGLGFWVFRVVYCKLRLMPREGERGREGERERGREGERERGREGERERGRLRWRERETFLGDRGKSAIRITM
jgi:hypothetical protein